MNQSHIMHHVRRQRGYFGIVLYQPKTIENLGVLIRSCGNFGAAFIATIGHRYHRSPGDTMNVMKHYPGFHFKTLHDCLLAVPVNADIVRVEVDGATELPNFIHPERAIYVLGGEDRSVPVIPCARSIKIDSRRCLNLHIAASIVMYDRNAKEVRYAAAIADRELDALKAVE